MMCGSTKSDLPDCHAPDENTNHSLFHESSLLSIQKMFQSITWIKIMCLTPLSTIFQLYYRDIFFY